MTLYFISFSLTRFSFLLFHRRETGLCSRQTAHFPRHGYGGPRESSAGVELSSPSTVQIAQFPAPAHSPIRLPRPMAAPFHFGIVVSAAGVVFPEAYTPA